MNDSPPEKLTAYQAHREGIRKLHEWEDNDFDRERYESRCVCSMTKWKTRKTRTTTAPRKRRERNRPQPGAPGSRRVPDPGLLRRQAPALARLERPGRRAVDIFRAVPGRGGDLRPAPGGGKERPLRDPGGHGLLGHSRRAAGHHYHQPIHEHTKARLGQSGSDGSTACDAAGNRRQYPSRSGAILPLLGPLMMPSRLSQNHQRTSPLASPRERNAS
jgi:hypothetical protein